MDDDRLIEQLRASADSLGTEDTDLDGLVHGAVRQGRRRRTRRRVGTVLAAVVVAGITGAVLAGGTTPTRVGLPAVDPAGGTRATPTAVPTSKGPTPAAAPTGTPTGGETPPVDSRVSGGPAKVLTTFTELLPPSLTVTRSSSEREEGVDGFAWQNDAALVVRDDPGTSYLFGGIGNGAYEDGGDRDGCTNLTRCESTELTGGGTLWVTSSPAGDKTGADLTFRYNRPGGGHVWLMERNYDGGNDPVTRPGLPLTRAEGQALVTSDRWDALFEG